MNVRLLLLLLIPGANSIAQDLINSTSPPKIIKTTPEFGDCNVDPGINEIVIIFDQDMSNGMSVVNTPFMPKINGDARWIDKRTFVIPVLLRPNSQYQLAFNSLRYTNFRSENGLALNPDELIFITRSVDATTQNKEAYQELFRYFPDYYSYSDLRGIDWHSEFKQSQTEFENSRTSLEFALKLIRILKKADDPHLWVEVDGQRYETGKVKITERNYEPAYIFRILQNKILDKRFTAIVGNHDSIGYIMLRDWNTDFKMLSLQAWGNANNPVIPT